MSTLTQQFDAADAENVMRGVISAMQGSYAPVLEECAPVVTKGVRANFNSSATPDGSNWPNRKIAGDGHPLLMDTGDLLQAATGGGPGHIRNVYANELAMGVSGDAVAYAATHNYGSDKRNIPAREYMGIGEPFIQECQGLISDFVVTAVF